ncbi:MAG: outer membrane protein assembly factor BamB [Planctomycetota bacterium]
MNAVILVWMITGLNRAEAQVFEGEEDDSARITGFSIPSTRAAAARAERARTHLAAERWNEAIEDLQVLIEEHRSELIPLSGRGDRDSPLHHGAAGWAASMLLDLPPAARELYERRYSRHANAALKQARANGNRQALVEVTERWPATEYAVLAWWTLGDLELELGNIEPARAAWGRALGRRLLAHGATQTTLRSSDDPFEWEAALSSLEATGAELSAGEKRRCQLALATMADENPLAEANRLRRDHNGSMRLPGPGEGAKGTPGPDASTWPRPFKLPPNHAFDPGNSGNLFPIRIGDMVLFSDSLQLFAVNAYSGALHWSSEKPSGWDNLTTSEKRDFFDGVSQRDTIISPAASERIVVSAHQIPITDLQKERFRNIAITTIIPDRRLYAYDLESGKELWNHRPPVNWDGESGSFTDRVSVAGPPVVSSSRIFVPVYRMYGRIEFYVACFDLVSGEPLWTTQLVSGQRELNMFARAEREFSAPPVRIEGDRVVVLTQLGAVAALDLFSGRILWETLYDQVPIPQRSSFSAQRLKNYWRNAPPVVADGVIVVTPFDGRDLIGFDLMSGDLLWSMPYSDIDQLAGPYRDDVNLLIGADANTVYLGGWPVMALRSSAGLHREMPIELAWRYPAGLIEESASTASRALLLADRIIIPTRSERIEVDRFGGGRRHKSVPWKGGHSGNLLVQDGTLYTLNNGHLEGYFEWDMLLTRGKRNYEESGGDEESTLYLAGLYSERSRTELQAGRTGQARDWLVESEELLEPYASLEEPSVALTQAMHSLLRTRALVYLDLADGSSARRALQRARKWAPDIESLRDTLIEEYNLLFAANNVARDELLETLGASCGSLSMSAQVELDPNLPYGWRFAPLIDGAERGMGIWRLPVSMWTSLERSQIAAEDAQPSQELRELHKLLAGWPIQPLPDPGTTHESMLDFAARRIWQLIELYGREPYARYEVEANQLLTVARSNEDREMLLRIGELYPGSLASHEANDTLLVIATQEGDIEAVAEITMSELPEDWSPEHATERELQLLMSLGATLLNSGNQAYPAALYRAMAPAAPNFRSDLPPHNGRTLQELASAFEDITPGSSDGQDLQQPDFQSGLVEVLESKGLHRFLGVIPPKQGQDLNEPQVLLFARDSGLRGREVSFIAYAADALNRSAPRTLWESRIPAEYQTLSWHGKIGFAPGAVVVATPEGVFSLSREDGSHLWNGDWIAPDGNVNSINVQSGLVIVSVRSTGDMDAIHALDWSGGLEIWSAEIDPRHQDRDLIVGSDSIVVMPRRNQTGGVVLDFFSGRNIANFELPTRIHQSAHDAAWIEDGLLIVPWFLNGRNEERNHIVAMDLLNGKEVWSVNFGEVLGGQRELRSIVQYKGRTFLVLLPARGDRGEGALGIFAELRIAQSMGATARISSFELEEDHRLIGIHQEKRVQLQSPNVYLYSFSEGEESMHIQSLNLPFGNLRWTHDVDISREDLHNSLIQLPAESSNSVAMVFSEKGERRLGQTSSTLHIMDKNTGRPLALIPLATDLGTSADVHLRGLGQFLILAGKDGLSALR